MICLARKVILATAQQKAYQKGYTAGRNRTRKSHDTIVAALEAQIEYWRNRYIDLRDGTEVSSHA